MFEETQLNPPCHVACKIKCGSIVSSVLYCLEEVCIFFDREEREWLEGRQIVREVDRHAVPGAGTVFLVAGVAIPFHHELEMEHVSWPAAQLRCRDLVMLGKGVEVGHDLVLLERVITRGLDEVTGGKVTEVVGPGALSKGNSVEALLCTTSFFSV